MRNAAHAIQAAFGPDHPITSRWKPERARTVEQRRALNQLRDHVNLGLKIIVATKLTRRPHPDVNQAERIDGTVSVYIDGGRIHPTWVDHRFAVIRETTFEDWSANTPDYIPGPKPQKWQAAGYRFFELATD